MIRFFIFLLILSVPGIYAAMHENFLIITNRDKNCFLTRLFYTVFPFSFPTFCLSVIIFLICELIAEGYSGMPPFVFFTEKGFVSSLSAVLIVIFLFRRFMLSSSVPAEFRNGFSDQEFYVFIPTPCRRSFLYLENAESDPLTPVKAELKSVEKAGVDIISSPFGEHIITDVMLKAFLEQDLTGFQTRPLIDAHRPPYQTKKNYYLFSAAETVPPLSRRTKMSKRSIYTPFIVTDDVFVYDKKDIVCFHDVNLSFEHLDYDALHSFRGSFADDGCDSGRPDNGALNGFSGIVNRSHHRFLILSQRTFRIMTEQFCVPRRYFLPVYFTDDEESAHETYNKNASESDVYV